MRRNRVIDRSIVTVGDALLPVESATTTNAASAHRAVATMLEERERAHRVGLPADFGADAIAQAAQAATYLTLAANCLGGSHRMLMDLLSEEPDFGPRCPIAKLKLVAEESQAA